MKSSTRYEKQYERGHLTDSLKNMGNKADLQMSGISLPK